MYAIDEIAADAEVFRAAVVMDSPTGRSTVKYENRLDLQLTLWYVQSLARGTGVTAGAGPAESDCGRTGRGGLSQIHLSGGEPTLYRELRALIAT